jgi:hypothetical protein
MKRRVINAFSNRDVLYVVCDDGTLWSLGSKIVTPDPKLPGAFSSEPHWWRVDLSQVEYAELEETEVQGAV